MDGQARSKDARKAGRAGGWTRIRDGIRRRKRQVLTSRMRAVFGGKRGASRIVSYWVFLPLC
jgi:hypothetical protein